MRKLAAGPTRSHISLLGTAALLALVASAGCVSGVAGTIWGRVLEEDTRKPIEGADVSLASHESAESSPRAARRVSTDASGRFRFSKVPPGRYRIWVLKPGFQECRLDARGNCRQEEQFLALRPGESGRADFLLRPAPRVWGAVLEDHGMPVFPGWVFFDPLGFEGTLFQAVLDANGHFRQETLPPGRYRISARRYSAAADQAVGSEWFYPGTTDSAKSEPVFLQVGVSTHVDIHFGPSREPVWVARVTTDEGEPIPYVMLTILRPERKAWVKERTERAGKDGRAELTDLRYGEYRILTSSVPPPFAPWNDPSAPPSSLERISLKIVLPPGRASETDIRLRPGLTLHGRYRWRGTAETATPEITVSFIHALEALQGVSLAVGSTPEGTGGFRVDGLLAGIPYQFGFLPWSVSAPHCVVGASVVGEPSSGALVFHEGGPVPSLDVWLERCATLLGRADCGAVAADRLEEAGPGIGIRRPLFAMVDHGSFILRGLTPGRYRVRCQGQEGEAEVTLLAGERKEVSLGSAKPLP